MEHKEKIIKDSISPITLSKQESITRQMKNCICKIHNCRGNGTGFFCRIPYHNAHIKILITNNHVLNENDVMDNKIITFSMNNNIKDIKIEKGRRKYTSEIYDTTIIEIKEKDYLDDMIEYLEIDDDNLKAIKSENKQFLEEHFNNLYRNESLYVLNYLGGKEIVLSYGFFVKIEASKIYHKCCTNNGSSGAPILSLENNKLIGIHNGSVNNFNFNLGTLIAYPIVDFQNIQTTKRTPKTPLNSITIKYKIYEYDEKLRLFGEEFVKNNKYNCVIILNGNTQDLSEHIYIDEKMRTKGYMEIHLKEIKPIHSMSHMFCRGIEEADRMLVTFIKDFSEWDTRYITDMSYLFCCCEELEKLPDISSWNTSNVIDMSNMFSYCGKLEYLPDISNWDTSNVINMSHMFANGWKIKELPDISKWDTSKVKNMEHIFTRCGFNNIPNISKWETSNLSNISYMFSFCYNLKSLPDISIWKIKSNINMKGMFYYCYYLENVPDISEWNITRETRLLYIFYYCHHLHRNDLLLKLSDKSKLGTKYLNIWYNSEGASY